MGSRSSSKRRYRALVGWFAATVLLCSSLRAQTQEELLEYLFTMNEAARQKVSSARLRLEMETRTPDGGRYRVQSERKYRDDWVWSETKSTVSGFPEGQGSPERFHRLIVNDRYIAHTITDRRTPLEPSPVVDAYEHSSPAEMSEEASLWLAGFGAEPNVFSFGFGTAGAASLREHFARAPPAITEIAREKNSSGDDVYVIRRFYSSQKAQAGSPYNEFTVDPMRGFLITRIVTRNARGVPFLEYDIKVEELSRGVWFPVEVSERRYVFSAATLETRQDVYSATYRFVDIKLNLPIPDEAFEVTALGVDPEKMVVRMRGIDGRLKGTMKVWQGGLIPYNLYVTLHKRIIGDLAALTDSLVRVDGEAADTSTGSDAIVPDTQLDLPTVSIESGPAQKSSYNLVLAMTVAAAIVFLGVGVFVGLRAHHRS